MSSALLTSFWRLRQADSQTGKAAAHFGEGGREMEVLFAQRRLISEWYRELVARGRAPLENELLLFLFSIFVSAFLNAHFFCGRYYIFPALCLAANSRHLKYFCYGATSQAAAQVLVKVSQSRQQPSFTSFFEKPANSRQRFPLCESLWLVLMSPFILFSAFLRVSVTTWGSG